MLFAILFLLMGYFLTITFVFMYKSLTYSRHTSLNVRFWKRTFYLFWSLELFLFFIYIYLYINATFETWALDLTRLPQLSLNSDLSFYNSLLLWFSIFLLLLGIHNSQASRFPYALLLGLFVVLVYLFFNEVYSVIYFSTFFFNYTFIFDSEENAWNLELESFFSRPNYLYFYSLLLLKIWHVVFILIFFIFFFNNVLKQPKLISQLNLFFLSQNFIFLFGFWYLTFLLFKKYFVLFYFSVLYGELFINTNYSFMLDIINYILSININWCPNYDLFNSSYINLFIFFL